jgi:hypothetical protein
MLGLKREWWYGYGMGWLMASLSSFFENGLTLDRFLGRVEAFLWALIFFIVVDRLFVRPWLQGRA